MFESLLPIIVPRAYFQLGNWPGSHLLLRHPDLAVTWVEMTGPKRMDYVNHDRQREIERSGVEIHALAMVNLRRQSQELFTHTKTAGAHPVVQVMMHEDGLGTSRLLLVPEITAAFPGGFWLAIPERSCGIVAPKNLSPEAHEEVSLLIANCCRDGTTPMFPGLHEPELFLVADQQRKAPGTS